MADVTVTGLTAARMKEIEAASVVDAEIDADGNLTLITDGGTRIEVGNSRGPQGNPGPGGSVTTVNNKTGSSITLTAEDVGAASQAKLDGLMPAGTIVMTGRSAAPSGWVLCQGQALVRADNPGLYAAIGVAYGPGNNTTTFNVPNFKGRVPVGYDASQTGFDTLGEIGGANSVALSVANLPAHDHEQAKSSRMIMSQYTEPSPSANDNNSGAVVQGRGAGRYGAYTNTEGNTTEKTGSGTAHNNLQPYLVVNYMIKL